MGGNEVGLPGTWNAETTVPTSHRDRKKRSQGRWASPPSLAVLLALAVVFKPVPTSPALRGTPGRTWGPEPRPLRQAPPRAELQVGPGALGGRRVVCRAEKVGWPRGLSGKLVALDLCVPGTC